MCERCRAKGTTPLHPALPSLASPGKAFPLPKATRHAPLSDTASLAAALRAAGAARTSAVVSKVAAEKAAPAKAVAVQAVAQTAPAEDMASPVTTGTEGGTRRKLWQIATEFHCSIIGTCLTSDDIAWICRRLGLVPASDSRPYEIHRYFVERAGVDGPESRLMQKRLDEVHGGALRRFSRAGDEAGWLALWDNSVAAGQVASAYWAVLSTRNPPDAIRSRAFADVHMLSHLMGGESRKQLRDNQDLLRRLAEAEARLTRQDRASAEKLASRDARIRELEARLAEQSAASTVVTSARTNTPVNGRVRNNAIGAVDERLARETAVLRRRLSVERARARQAEGEADRLRTLFDGRTDRPAIACRRDLSPAFLAGDGDGGGTPPLHTETVSTDQAGNDLGGRSILYVGGRTGSLPKLKAAVETRNGQLLHHDGGLEQPTRGLACLVEKADLVVCPIDCVSHDACLRVKGLCRRLGKPFVPMRSSGASSFIRVLGDLAS